MKNRRLIFIVLLGIFIILLGPRLVGLEESILLLRQANFFWVLLILASLGLLYISAAQLNRNILSKIGPKLPFLDNFRLALVGVFAIHLLPVGSLGGATLEWWFLKKRKFNSGQILLAFVLRTIYVYLSFALIFLVSAILINPETNLDAKERLVLYTIVFIAVAVFGYLVYMYKFEKLYFKRFHQLVGVYNFFRKLFKHSRIESAKIEATAQEIYHNAHQFTRDWRASVPIFYWGILYWIGDILCLYFALRSFGYSVDPTVLLFSYTVSTVLAMASFIPGGVGVMEASLSIIMISLGVPSAIAIISVLLYRLFAFWLLIPLGGWAFNSLRSGKKVDLVD